MTAKRPDPSALLRVFTTAGFAAFLAALVAQNAQPDRLKVVIAGGAHILDQIDAFNIGLKNIEALKARFDEYKLMIHHENTGGSNSRTLSLEIGSGCSSIKIFGEGEEKV